MVHTARKRAWKSRWDASGREGWISAFRGNTSDAGGGDELALVRAEPRPSEAAGGDTPDRSA